MQVRIHWKKRFLPLLLASCGLLFLLPATYAQDSDTLLTAAIKLRPLDALLDEAQTYSPLLKMEAINAELLYSDLRLLKKEWSNYVALSGSFQVGNVQFIDNLSSGNTPDVRTVTRENIFAVAGVTLRLPLSDFISKPERRKQLELQLEQERYSQQQKTYELREIVIRQYNDLQRALRVLEIRNRDLNFHILASETAERFFREGDMKLDEYTAAYNKRNEAEIRLEESKLDTQLLFLLLQEVVGSDIRSTR
jgi:outer membrane protein TolC